MMIIPMKPMGFVGIPWEWKLWGKLMGIKMEMVIELTGIGGNGIFKRNSRTV